MDPLVATRAYGRVEAAHRLACEAGFVTSSCCEALFRGGFREAYWQMSKTGSAIDARFLAESKCRSDSWRWPYTHLQKSDPNYSDACVESLMLGIDYGIQFFLLEGT